MPGRPIRAARFFHNERTQPTRPAPHLSFIARPTANTSVFHRTKGLRQGHRHARQCPKPRLAGLRLDSRLPRTGPIGCGVHFFEYSARQVVCIRIGSVNQHLQAPLYCVLEQGLQSAGTQTHASRRIGRQNTASRPVCCKIAAVPTVPRCRNLRFLHGADGGRYGQKRAEAFFYAWRRSFYAN